MPTAVEGRGGDLGADDGSEEDAVVPAKAWCTSGMTLGRRPPKRMALIGTPLGSSHSGAMAGHCEAGAVKRAFAWAAGSFEPGSHSLPFQSMSLPGGG